MTDDQLFAEMLTQRPLGRLSDTLSAKDLEYMTKMAAQRFDQITSVLRSMPNTILLVLR
jgi:hypothetical protein